MPRPCVICSDNAKMKTAAEMIASGATDQAVANAVGGGLNRMSVARHRTNHIVAPAKALADAAGKGRDATEQRARVMAAAEAGDPSAYLALASIVADLRKVHERLERTADAAETDNQRLAVASLSARQLRVAEVRSKMGGIGGYTAQKAPGTGDGAPFSINFIFSTAGEQHITLDAAPVGNDTRVLDRPVLDGPVLDVGGAPAVDVMAAVRGIGGGSNAMDALDGLGPMSPALARLAAMSRAGRSG